jgi:hypothetical protein
VRYLVRNGTAVCAVPGSQWYSQPYDDYGIKPVIDKRQLWREDHSGEASPTRVLFNERVDSFVYDEQGHVLCVCPQTQEQREMFFCGADQQDPMRSMTAPVERAA